jgi:hypothetical protein
MSSRLLYGGRVKTENSLLRQVDRPCRIWVQCRFMSNQQLTKTKRWLRKRRSQRIELTVPIVVHRKEGPQFSERAQTLVVNAHGALMALAEKVTPEQRLVMQNIDSGEQKECHVVYMVKEVAGPTKVAVEFTGPTPSFWRIAYPRRSCCPRWALGSVDIGKTCSAHLPQLAHSLDTQTALQS